MSLPPLGNNVDSPICKPRVVESASPRSQSLSPVLIVICASRPILHPPVSSFQTGSSSTMTSSSEETACCSNHAVHSAALVLGVQDPLLDLPPLCSSLFCFLLVCSLPLSCEAYSVNLLNQLHRMFKQNTKQICLLKGRFRANCALHAPTTHNDQSHLLHMSRRLSTDTRNLLSTTWPFHP